MLRGVIEECFPREGNAGSLSRPFYMTRALPATIRPASILLAAVAILPSVVEAGHYDFNHTTTESTTQWEFKMDVQHNVYNPDTGLYEPNVVHTYNYAYIGDMGNPPYYSMHTWEIDQDFYPAGGGQIPGLYGAVYKRATGTSTWTYLGQYNPTWAP
jgi:hypothetical protein